MAKFTIKGIDEYVAALERIERNTDDILKDAIYEGAGIIADGIKSGLNTISIEENSKGMQAYGTPEKPVRGISRRQRADLINSMGIAPIKRFGANINTKIGWDGYGSVKTRAHPQGVPNILLMRAVESGTSFMQKNPVVRKSVNKVRKKAQDAIKNKIDEAIKERLG